MDNNLDDFFRKKQDEDLSSDGWDEPSEQVWENAQPQFPTYPQQRRTNKMLILLVLLLLTFLAAGGNYVWKTNLSKKLLNEEIVLLKKQLKQQQTTFNTLNSEYAALQEEHFAAKEASSNTVETLKNTIKNNTTYCQNTLQQQQRTIQELGKKQERLEKRNEELNMRTALLKKQFALPKPIFPTVQHKEKELTDYKSIPLKYLEDKPLAVTSEDSKEINLPIISIPEKTWKKYEIGLDRSSLTLTMQVANEFENINNIQDSNMEIYQVSKAHGFHFGYAPIENLYIKTGLRYSNFFIENTHISGAIYDKSSEYIDANGNLANDLILNSSTNNNKVAQTITVGIPNGTTLETGDLLLSTLTAFQNFDLLQIPFGVAYYRGKRRVQWEFQGGLTWNFVNFGQYDLHADFQANNIEIPTNNFTVITKSESLSQYLGGYVGIGGNYRFSDKWQLRAGINFESNALNFNGLRRSYSLDSGTYLSLNYRF